MVHIIFEDEEKAEQTGKQNFKGLGRSDGQKKNKQRKNASMPDRCFSSKNEEIRKKTKRPSIVGKRLFTYEENELMTRYDGFWVLKEGVEKLAELKSTLEKEMFENKEMKKKLLAAKRLAHSKLKRELRKRKMQENCKLSLKESKPLKTPKEIQSPKLKKHKKSKKPSTESNADNSLSKAETGSDKNKKVDGKTEHSTCTLLSDSSKENDQQIFQNKEIQSPKLKKHKKSKKPSAESTADISLSKTETGSDKNKKVDSKTQHSTSILISDSSKENDQQIFQNKEIHSPKLKKHKKSKKPSAESTADISLSKTEIGSDKNKKVDGKTEHSTCKLISDSSKENDQQIFQNKKKKRKNAQSSNLQTISQETDNIDLSPTNKKNIRKDNDKVKNTTKGSKRKFLEIGNCSVAQSHEIASQKELRKKNAKMDSEEKHTVISTQNNNIVPLKFEDNDLMSQFDGIWVKRTALPVLNRLREEHLKHIYSAREEGNSSEELTKVEQHHYHRLMKKKIRMEYRYLRKELIIQGRKENMTMDGNFNKNTV